MYNSQPCLGPNCPGPNLPRTQWWRSPASSQKKPIELVRACVWGVHLMQTIFDPVMCFCLVLNLCSQNPEVWYWRKPNDNTVVCGDILKPRIQYCQKQACHKIKIWSIFQHKNFYSSKKQDRRWTHSSIWGKKSMIWFQLQELLLVEKCE